MSTLAASDNGLLGDLSTKKLDNCKRWTGWQFIVISWGVGEGVEGAAMTRGSKGMKSLCKDSDKRQRAKHFVYTSGSLVAFEFAHRLWTKWRNV